jgi:hypothetical protein
MRINNMPIVRFIAGGFLALLPAPWRKRWMTDIDLEHAALASSTALTLLCLAAVIVRYIFFFQERIGELGATAITRGADEALGDRRVQYGMGIAVLLEYIFQPLTLLLVYFAIESAGRLVAAFVTGEIVPSLPLQAIEWTRQKMRNEQAKRELGPPIMDLVEVGTSDEFDLRIASCRPRPNWNNLMTVSYQEELYEIVREEHAAKPRPWVYVLRKKPEGKVVRGLHAYAPDELLPREE